MIMTDQNLQKPNTVTLENRSKLTVTGVRDVDSFDEQNVVAYTDYGQLTIQGSGLSISQLSVESGDLLVEGFYVECPADGLSEGHHLLRLREW